MAISWPLLFSQFPKLSKLLCHPNYCAMQLEYIEHVLLLSFMLMRLAPMLSMLQLWARFINWWSLRPYSRSDTVDICRDIARHGSNSDFWFTRKVMNLFILELMFSFLNCMRILPIIIYKKNKTKNKNHLFNVTALHEYCCRNFLYWPYLLLDWLLHVWCYRLDGLRIHFYIIFGDKIPYIAISFLVIKFLI